MLTRSRGLATQALSVVNNVAKQQFTVTIPGALAHLDYEESGKKIKFIYTEVPSAFQGKGVGKLLAKNAFDYASQKKIAVTIQCHFLADYYTKNKQMFPELQVKLDLEEENKK